MINLTYLNLYSNQLTGEIPIEIGNLTNLTYLDLQMNELTGEIPSEIGSLVNLYLLHLNENNFYGMIPPNLCDLSIDWDGIWSDYYQIPFFNIDNNNLCSPYPSCLSQNNIGYQNTSDCIIPGASCVLDNEETGFYDCELCCWEEFFLSWLGDGYCDYLGGCGWEGPHFDCYELSYDCGDCNIDFVNDSLEICLETDICDSNSDGELNIQDVIVVINYVITIEYDDCYDFNNDNELNIIDIVLMVDIILNG